MDRRIKTKLRLVRNFGGKCNRCGYARCLRGLDFHHIDPKEKKYQISTGLARHKSWEDIQQEAAKCILLCKLCHAELHENLWDISDIELVRLNIETDIIKNKQVTQTGSCPNCGNPVYNNAISCSKLCSYVVRQRISWPSMQELKQLLVDHPRTSVAKMLGVSDTAIRKRVLRYGDA